MSFNHVMPKMSRSKTKLQHYVMQLILTEVQILYSFDKQTKKTLDGRPYITQLTTNEYNKIVTIQ